MIYHEEYQSKSEAMIREYQIKKLPRKQKEKLVETVQE
jgi:putative endonuclease